MVTTSFLLAPGLPGLVASTGSSQCIYSASGRRHLGHRRLKSSPAFAHENRWSCRCFVEEVSHAWREWRERKNSWSPEKDVKKLPVMIVEGGRRWQYVFDGERIRTVEVNEEALQCGKGKGGSVSDRVAEGVAKVRQTLQRIFVPDQVQPHYLVYLKWKLIHRFLSSILHVQCTQAMLWAIGVGAKRRLPAAAALNWVMKDGLGRLGKLSFTASLGRTFDSNLKRVRFSTSILFSVSVGLKMLTPVFPHHFLLLATLANIAKSISHAAYLATSPAIHRSFALGDNLADISAKGQAQTVIADNLGLAVAQLQAVHLQTLNKERLKIIINTWVEDSRVPSFEEVTKVECASLLNFFNGCKHQLALQIGAVPLRSLTPEGLMNILDLHETQRYALCLEPLSSSPFRGHFNFSQPGLLLWLNERATTEDIIMGVLQACHLGAKITSKASLQQLGEEYERGNVNGTWRNLLLESRKNAEVDFKPLLDAIKDGGCHTKRILLSPKEQCSFSILEH